VNESRQQRRAREQAERKNAGRPASPLTSGAVRRPLRGYSVEVRRIEFDEQDEDDGVWWGAEAGLTDESVGYEFESREDLAELLAEVVEDARTGWGSRYELRLEWTLTGDVADPPVSLTQAAAAVGFTLPERL
jgi:hypothetical protein